MSAKNSRCRVCEHEQLNDHYVVKEVQFGTGEQFDYFQCQTCKCLQISEIPSGLSRFYPAHYYSFRPVRPPDDLNRLRSIFVRSRDRWALRGGIGLGSLLYLFRPEPSLRSLLGLGLKSETSFLEVGCGNGILLQHLRSLGFRKLLGVDAFIASPSVTSGEQLVERKTIAEVEGIWDVILYNHSFEHICAPVEEMNNIARRLDRCGTLILRMPIIPSYAWHKYGVNWNGIDAPRHLHIHSPMSVYQLAQRVGLTIVKVQHESSAFTFWASEQAAQGLPIVDPTTGIASPNASLFGRTRLLRYRAHAWRLSRAGLGDCATFYLKRRLN